MIARGSPSLARTFRLASTALTWTLGLVASAMTTGGLFFAISHIRSNEPTLAAPGAVISAAGLATLGWLVSAANQRALSRKQHTLNLLIQMRHAELYNRHLLAILALCPAGHRPSDSQIDLISGATPAATGEEIAFRRGVIYVLNYWEFVCAALIVGDLDAELVRRTVRQHIVSNFDKFADVVRRDRDRGDRQTYRHLERIAREWRDLGARPDLRPLTPPIAAHEA